MPDGITMSPELRELLSTERAVHVQTRLATLVATVCRLMDVRETDVLNPDGRRPARASDARRIAIVFTARFIRGYWSIRNLAALWHYRSYYAVQQARQVHGALMATDATYRATVQRVAAELAAVSRAERGQA